MAKIPRGEENLICPLHKEPMSEVCHKCPWWTEVSGTAANGKDITDWQCAVGWIPRLLIETAQQMRQAGASTDKVANEVRDFHKGMAKFNIGTAQAILGGLDDFKQLGISDGDEH